jgi:hypothetical protein
MQAEFLGKNRTKSRTSKVVTYRVSALGPTDEAGAVPLAQPGTVAVLIAPKGDPLFKQLRAAIKGDVAARSVLAKKLFAQLNERKQVPLEEAKVAYAAAASVGSVKYKEASVLTELFLASGQGFGYAILPFNGTRFRPNGLVFQEQYDPHASDTELRVAMIFCDPPAFTQAERGALAKVDPDRIDLTIGGLLGPKTSDREFVQGVMLVTAIVAVGVLGVTIFGISSSGSDIEHLGDDEVKKLGPSETASELMRRRVALLSGKPT